MANVAQVDLATASELFDTMVTLKFQNFEYLFDTVEERHGTEGDATNVPVSAIIEMSLSTFAPINVPVTPVNQTNIQIVPYDYKLKTDIGGGYKTLFAYNQIVDQSRAHGKAVSRMKDFIKINAILSNPAYPSSIYNVPVTVGVNTGMNSDKMTAALSYLEAQGMDVHNYQVSSWMPAYLKASLLNDQKVTNIFFNNKKPLTDDIVTDYLGTKVCTLGQNGINSLPYTGSLGSSAQWYVPLVHRDAVVQIYNRDPMTSITWVQQEDRYDLLSAMTTGSSVIQTNGIALVTANFPYVAN